jgi:putative chitinase
VAMIDWRPIQKRLGVTPDGVAGPFTYQALLTHVANRQLSDKGIPLGKGCAKHFPAYEINTPLRIAHFVAQAAHESGGFRWMQEIWGPTAAQRKYEGRADLGNVCVGDGKRYAGRGVFQLTGRANYRTVGARLGLDLEDEPELAADPTISVLIACDYWRSRKINPLADADDIMRVTRKVNGGLNGIEDRMLRLARAKEILL